MIPAPITPSNLPYQDHDDEQPTTSGAVEAHRLLADEVQPFEDSGSRDESTWRRLVAQFHPSRWRARQPSRRSPNEACFCEKSMGRRRTSRKCLRVGLGVLVVLGIFQLLTLLVNLPPTILPSRIHRILQSWGQPHHIGANTAHYPTDFSRDVLPIPCHSHNDYWRLAPLYSALGAGCIGVEADVWLIDSELYVGHDMASLTRNRTLRRLYVDPLVSILEGQNPVTEFYDGEAEGGKRKMGVFDTDPDQTLVLLIDFKTEGHETWPSVVAALEPLRERGYLSHRNGSTVVEGPITVVATGNAPFELVLDDTALGSLPTGKFSERQLSLLRGQVRGAHSRGLKARYWDLPYWPIGLRNYVWRVLVEEGVDLLNVDDLEGAARRDWGWGGGGGGLGDLGSGPLDGGWEGELGVGTLAGVGKGKGRE
ncbi:hypothetical protein G7Y79_00027g060740 [Physcia stellaris]|nr:hypothetical protein G7Y79_00027g060740 [Physcia stellaris]